MVAIVTGEGVGLERSSAFVLGSRGQLGSAGLGRDNGGVYVNAATGNLVISRQDEFLIGKGPDASIGRTYNSQAVLSDGDNEDKWQAGLYRKVVGTNGNATITRIDWDGSDTVYQMVSAGLYRTKDGGGAYDTLAWNGSQWTWTDGNSRVTDLYDAAGKLLSTSDTDGNSLAYAYDVPTGLLTRVTTSNGEYTDFGYYAGTNRLEKLTTQADSQLTRVFYEYDGDGRLSVVKVNIDPLDNSKTVGANYTTTYAYDGSSKRVASIAQQDGTLLEIAYTLIGSDYRVTRLTQTVSAGVTRVTGFFYDTTNRVTTITDPLGGVTTMAYDVKGNLTQLVLPVPVPGAAAPTTSFVYNANGDIESMTENGRTTAYSYDANGNMTLSRDAAGNTVKRLYGANNQLLTETRYVGPDLDGAGAGAADTPMTARYVYDGENHLLFSISAEGEVTEYRYNTPGQLTSTIAYPADFKNVAGLAWDFVLDETAMVNWANGIADKSNVRRTDTTYDTRGNVRTVTRYSAADSLGNGLLSSAYSRDTYFYDQAGQLIDRFNNASAAVEHFVYDGLGRLISSTDMAANTTTFAFNDAASTTTVTLANGRTSASVYSRAGERISFTQSGADIATAVITEQYDGLGRLRKATDPTGRSTYFLYDNASRKVADVTADGAVTEYGYDSSHRLVKTIAYINKLDANQIAALSNFTAGGAGGANAGGGGVGGPVGSTLLVNGSFDTPGTGGSTLAHGLSSTSLTGWAKANGQNFEQVLAGQFSVTGTDGAYWLDLDSVAGSGQTLPTGPNLLANGSFDTSAASYTTLAHGRSSTTLPNWTKANAEMFEQVTAGQFGVTGTDGGYWLDLDSVPGSGYVTAGSNLLVNASFEQSGSYTDTATGRSNTNLPSWSKTNSETFEQVSSGQLGVAATDGSFWLDLDSVPGTGLAPTGSNLVVNGSFDTSGTYTTLAHGRSNTNLPGWNKTNPEDFEQVASGQLGVTGTDGAFWLDLDSVPGAGGSAGYIPIGTNRLVNGSFDQSGTYTTTATGRANTNLTGWNKTNPEDFEQVASGQLGVTGTDGGYWLDLDSVPASGATLPTGDNLLLNGSFDASGSYVSLPHGRSNTTLPGWNKANPETFEQVAWGQLGVTGTNGTYWLDMDSVATITGYNAIGSNLLSNGSFDSSGSYTTLVHGRSNTTLPGWSKTNPETFEQVASGQLGLTAADGAYWLDLDSVPGSGLLVPVGSNLVSNGSFENWSPLLATYTATGVTSPMLSSWTKTNPEVAEGVLSGQFGVSATQGSYWLDLDSFVNGVVPVGQNLLVNGSFEQSGTYYETMPWGRANRYVVPGWTTNTAGQIKQVTSGQGSVTASSGSYWLDLDGYSPILFSATNMNISQTVNLNAGQTMLLQFDHANRTTAASGSFEVYWNDVLVATINETGTTMVTKNYQLTAIQGANQLRFKGTGTANQVGASLDNVRLFNTQPPPATANNMDFSQGISGLTAGQTMLLQFDHANRTTAASGSFEVYWNSTLVATISETGTTMTAKSYQVIAAAGNNTLRFKGTGTVDGSGASLDNVRVFAMAPDVGGGNMDISQTVPGLTAGQVVQLRYDHANRTTAASGSFEVYWNNTLIDTILSTGTAWQTKTYNLTAIAGNNAVRFKGTGIVDANGASLDNVRLFATEPVITGGNMDISQTVGGLAAGQTMLLEFDHANRTTGASGSFEVWWNNALVATISETGTTMVTKNYQLTALSGNNTLRFKGTGAADANGASIDNVRLRATYVDVGGGNMDIRQTVEDLEAGQVMQLQFDHANRTSSGSGSFEVYWNDALIASITDTGTTMQSKTYFVTAVAGNNVLRFKGLGTVDANGASIDNVRLFATQAVATGGNMDIYQTIPGLAAGQTMQLQFDYANRTYSASGSFEVYWNDELIDQINTTGAATQTKTHQLTAIGGNNSLRFKGIGPVDADGASIDNVRLHAMTTPVGGGNMDISQTVGGLTAGQVMQIQFDHANRTSAASGSFEVYWNNALVATINSTGTAMQTQTYQVTAIGGNNTLRFKGTGTVDNAGASIDNVRLHAMIPVVGGGNMDINQVVPGLAAGQTVQLQFDHANRTTSGSGSFEVWWNGSLVETITSTGTAMQTMIRNLVAIAGNNTLRFVGTGTVDAVGASIDNVRLYATAVDTGGGNMDISQAVPNLTAGQSLQLQFNHANRTTTASGGFEVWWNTTKLATITNSTLAMQPELYNVTAQAGTNTLRFVGIGTVDAVGASIDNVRLFATQGAPTPPTPAPTTDALAGMRPLASPTKDAWTWRVYDAADRLVETIDATGAVTTFAYDGDSRLVSSRSYANAIAPATVAGFKTTTPTAIVTPNTNAATDRLTRSFYDNDGRVIATLDGAGGLTRFEYDEAGFKIRELGAARAAASNLWPSGTLAELIASVGTSASDRRSDFVYDGRGLLRFAIDATAKPVEYVYDANDNVIRTVDYAGSIGPAASYSLAYVTAQLSSTGLAANAANRISRTVYDAAGRAAFSIDATNAVSAFAYDNVGNLIKQTAYATAYTVPGDQILATMQAWASGQAGNGANRISRNVYDLAGRIAYTVDAEGYITEHQYDTAGRGAKDIRYAGQYTVVDGVTKLSLAGQIGGLPADAISTLYGYDAAGRLTDVTRDVAAGVTSVTHFVLDALGRATDTIVAYNSATDVSTTRRLFDTGGRVISETRGFGTGEAATTLFDYDRVGNLLTVTDARNNPTTRDYDSLGRVVKQTVQVDGNSLNNLVTINEYDAFGNLVRVNDPRLNNSFLYYDKLGRAWLQVDAEGYATRTTYTAFGQAWTVTRYATRPNGTPTVADPPAIVTNPAKDAITTFGYDRNGRLTSVTDAELKDEAYQFNAFGDRTNVRNKLGSGIASTDPAYEGFAVTYTFDKLGRMLTETLPVGAQNVHGTTITSSITTKFDYDSRGNRTKKTEAFGIAGQERVTHYFYDKASRLIEERRAAIAWVADDLTTVTTEAPSDYFTYDLRGNLIHSITAKTATVAGTKTFFYYDALDRKTFEVSAVGTLSKWTYDGNGNLETARIYTTPVTIPGGPGGTPPANGGTYRLTSFGYDRANRLTGSTVANLRTGAFNGASYATTGTDTITTTRDYDAGGNVVREVDGVGNADRYFYDKLGRRVAKVDREDFLTVWTLNSEGNADAETRYATRVSSPPAVGASIATLIGLVGGGNAGIDRTTSFNYDRNGRRLSETRAGVVAWILNGGQLEAAGTNATIYYNYNALGLVADKTEANGDVTHFGYDKAGRLIWVKEPVIQDNDGLFVRRMTENFYDGLGNLVRVEVNKEGGAAIDDRVTKFEYGAGGRLARTTDAMTFERSFEYDAAGRVVKESYQRSKSDQTLLDEATAYRYDAAGRTIVQTAATKIGGIWQFGDAVRIRYNAFGEVSGRGLTGGPNDAAVYQESFDYDSAGRLWRTTEGDGSAKLFVHDRNGAVALTIASTGTDLAGDSIDDALGRLTNNGANLVGAVAVSGVTATILVQNRRGETVESREPFRELSSNGAGGFNMATILVGRTYNAFGEVATETDARGYATGNMAAYTTEFSYNSMGRLIEKKSPTVNWTSNAGVTTTGRPTETYYYDLSGRLAGVRDANNHVTTRLLLAGTGHGDTEGLVTAEYHGDDGVARTFYDVFGDARLVRNELYNSTNVAYNAASDEKRVYDKMGRLVEVTQRGGLLIDSYAYDSLGRRTKHWNSFLVGAVERTDYDLQGRVTLQTDYSGTGTSYAYAWNTAIATAGLGDFDGWTKTTTLAGGLWSTESTDYFGHVTARTNLSHLAYGFSYDKGGRLLSTTGPSGYSVTTSWLNTGRLYQTVDIAAAGKNAITAKYGYDVAGNRTYEGYSGTVYSFKMPSGTSVANLTLQSATIAYDAMNRIASFIDKDAGGNDRITVTNYYDLAGNVRRITSSYPNIAYGGANAGADLWYDYDNMNRITIADGVLDVAAGGVRRGATGVDIAYDKASRRATQTRDAQLVGLAMVWVPDGGYQPEVPIGEEPPYGGTYEPTPRFYQGVRREEYTYRADGALANVKFAETTYEDMGDGVLMPTGVIGLPELRAEFTRDEMGRIIQYREWDNWNTPARNRYGIQYDIRGNITYENVSQRKVSGNGFTFGTVNTYVSEIHNEYSSDGRLLWSTSRELKNNYDEGSNGAPDTRTDYTYAWWDDARVATMTLDSDTHSTALPTTVSSYAYDGAGRVAYVDITGRRHTVSFAYTPEGQILNRRERSDAATNPEDMRYFASGAQIGEITNNGNYDPVFQDYAASIQARNIEPSTTPAPFRFNTTAPVLRGTFGIGPGYDYINPISDGTNATDSSYTVRGGDTLQSIAANFWGDGAMWYLIAQANGLTGAEQLIEGQSLIMPDRVTNIHNNSNTFEVYDPNRSLGDLNPTAPKPPKKAGKCAAIGMILLTVIAVAVSAVVAPWATGIIAGKGATLIGGIAAAMAGGAIGGAAGAIASQAVGVATGLQDKFDWKGVAMAAIGGAVGGGLGKFGALAQAGKIGGNLGRIGNFLSGSSFLSGAANGVLSNVVGQGVGLATGLQSKFDWLGVATAGLGGGVSAQVGHMLGATSFAESRSLRNIGANVGTSAASAIANAAARSLIEGTGFGDNLMAALPDVIGSTIGNLLAASLQGRGGTGEAELEKIPQSEAEAQYILEKKNQALATSHQESVAKVGPVLDAASQTFGQELPGGASFILASQDRVWVNPDEDPRLRGQPRVEVNGDEDPSELVPIFPNTRGLRPGQPIPVAEARRFATMWLLNPDAPIFIGGGGDGYSFGLTNIVGPYARNREGGGNFLLHGSAQGARVAVEVAYALGKPIIIVGHSWGAYRALDVAEYAISRGIRVDLLATMDPVTGGGWLPMTRQQMARINSGVRDWINVRATGYETPPGGAGDGWAYWGGRMDTNLQRMARNHYDAPVSHANFDAMMRRGNVEARIREIYAARRRR